MLLVQLLWLRSICVIACRVNKHYCNFPKSVANTLALLYEWGCNKPLCCTVLYSDTIKSRASVELTAVNCWKLYFVVYYIIYCDTCLCSQADTVSCCLASLDFLWVFFYFRRLIHLYQHVYSCGVVIWSSTDFLLTSVVFSLGTTASSEHGSSCCFLSVPLYLICCYVVDLG